MIIQGETKEELWVITKMENPVQPCQPSGQQGPHTGLFKKVKDSLKFHIRLLRKLASGQNVTIVKSPKLFCNISN